jgi:hypothetical protein
LEVDQAQTGLWLEVEALCSHEFQRKILIYEP